MGDGSRISSQEDARQALSATRSSAAAFDYSQRASTSGVGTVHRNLNPHGKIRECLDTAEKPSVTPIAFAMDVTRSRGPDAKLIYEQLLPMLGSLYLSGAVVDPQFLFMAFGDAKSDRAPLQVGQFESDERMDGDLEKMWLEEGGGGTGEESSELVAYFLARKTRIDAVEKRGKKGFCFITSDEAPYPVVSKGEVERVIGDKLEEDILTPAIFAELQERFHTYLMYPGKPLAARQDDIDAEIRQRLLKAGGRFEHCSIRASLIWNTFDDLDLHVVTPDGDHIHYAARQSRCGGELDVDRNAGGRQTREPVENIRWAKGTAKPGKYQVYVRNYAYHDDSRGDVPFKVELDIDGVIQRFEGKTKAGVTGPTSDITAFEFIYAPKPGGLASDETREAYSDETILSKWRTCIPYGNIIRLTDAKWTTEAAIGIMLIHAGKTLEDIVGDMRLRAIAQEGIDEVTAALQSFTGQAVISEVGEEAFS